MKRYHILTLTALFMAVILLNQSCTHDFEKINTDPNGTPRALPNQLLAPALVDMVATNMLRNRNFNNELMQVTVNVSDAEYMVFRYDIRANVADNTWNNWYSQLTNFKDIFLIASEEDNYNESYMGISLILQSWVHSLLTDTYGDTPYFEANKARDSLIFEPRFDKQQDIYFDIFEKLDSANNLLKVNRPIDANADPVFNGSVGNWRRFGNALQLRLLGRIAHKAEVADTVLRKFRKIVENTTDYPRMTSNAHSAVLRWTGVPPYVSPFVNSVREQDFRGPAIASFFIDNLVTWNDPRIDIPTWGADNINRWGIAASQGSFVGVPSGYAVGEVVVKRSYFFSNTSARSLMTDPMTGQIMNFAEQQLLLAEAALKGWIDGNPETFYNTGALNSITLWIPEYNVPIGNYLSAADMQWFESDSFEEKMEKIHLQKYYAMFMMDFQQWFEYRRTGYPTLPKGAGLMNNGEIPSRLNYPVYVQSTNPTNYRSAVSGQGPDNISTKVWWQKP